MKKFAYFAIPLFATFLWAQEQTRTVTTKTTTWNGTLVDAGCQTTHTEHKESSTKRDPETGSTTTRTQTTHTQSIDCPVTTTTTSFGLLTSDGKFLRFDEPSNTKVVEIVKGNKDWTRFINDRAPLKVRVVGMPNGEFVVVESIR